MTLGQYKKDNEKLLRNKVIKRITLERLRYLNENVNLLANVDEDVHVVVVESYSDIVDNNVEVDIKNTLLANDIVKAKRELRAMVKELYAD